MSTQLPTGDVAGLVEPMIEAFFDDPLYAWLHPDPTRREDALRWTFALILEQAVRHGEISAAADGMGVAIWTWPGQDLLDGVALERFATFLRAQIGGRAEDALAGMSGCAEHAPATGHATLHSICVIPERRGSGVGAGLVGRWLERCDAEGVTAALDSSNSRNLSFYERLGFRVVAEVEVPGGGPTMWPMHRAPRG